MLRQNTDMFHLASYLSVKVMPRKRKRGLDNEVTYRTNLDFEKTIEALSRCPDKELRIKRGSDGPPGICQLWYKSVSSQIGTKGGVEIHYKGVRDFNDFFTLLRSYAVYRNGEPPKWTKRKEEFGKAYKKALAEIQQQKIGYYEDQLKQAEERFKLLSLGRIKSGSWQVYEDFRGRPTGVISRWRKATDHPMKETIALPIEGAELMKRFCYTIELFRVNPPPESLLSREEKSETDEYYVSCPICGATLSRQSGQGYRCDRCNRDIYDSRGYSLIP